MKNTEATDRAALRHTTKVVFPTKIAIQEIPRNKHGHTYLIRATNGVHSMLTTTSSRNRAAEIAKRRVMFGWLV